MSTISAQERMQDRLSLVEYIVVLLLQAGAAEHIQPAKQAEIVEEALILPVRVVQVLPEAIQALTTIAEALRPVIIILATITLIHLAGILRLAEAILQVEVPRLAEVLLLPAEVVEVDVALVVGIISSN